MIKMVFAWRDHPDRSAEQCEAHYRSVHMPMARAAFTDVEGFVALVYNRVRSHRVNDFNRPEPVDAPADHDAWVELWFTHADALTAAMARPELAAMFDDHRNFMACDEPANIHVYEVDETLILGRRPGLD